MPNLIERTSSALIKLNDTINRLLRPSLYDDPNLNKVMTDWIPKVDLKEDENEYIVQADIPGVAAKDVEIVLANDMLTITGKKESEVKVEQKNYLRIERTSGSFHRSISLPECADASHITATFKHGVLEIIVPKNKNQNKKKIVIREE